MDTTCEASNVLAQLFDVIESRRTSAPEGSYTARLFSSGETEILKKIGEEAVEVVVAATRETNDRVIYEMADLVYHCMVLLAAKNLAWRDVEAELAQRMR
jgi:phosphoribosyl-ATP pyrophosphohydrolase